MTVRFACGHLAKVSHTIQDPPVCPECGERRIARVDAPPPSIRGVCSGPHVTSVKLDPIAVNLCLNGAKPLPVPIDPSIERSEKKPRSLAREAP